ncbi:MAG TPA: DUF5320 domain-containing protein [bacterium]|nr:DUF5320 domain-containing protein [bacterium]HPP29600.1 DUF5320 domain-containing protein [bacterium]
MPGRDGTGPSGQGPMTGRMRGTGNRRGRRGAGPAGFCICPACNEKVIHQAGIPCSAMLCPKCGTRMVRG